MLLHPRNPRVWILGALALAAGGALLVARAGWDDVRNLPMRVATGWVAPRPGATVQLRRPERRGLQDLGARLAARIVWSSNRSGNHELYLLETATGQVRLLTEDPHVDFASRFSPDGRTIVFARSRREWVSFREIDGWDLWLVGIDGSGERRLVEHGYHPRWTADGRAVVFHRGARVLRVDVATGTEELLWDGGDLDVGDPELDPSGRYLATGIGGQGARVVDLQTGAYARLTDDHVCQTTWVPGAGELLWVAPAGNGGTRVMRGTPDGARAEVFMDLPGERSHEYFPVLSNDGRWMVWAAAAEGHEHDRADYEIYLWEAGTDWSTATRLTFHTGNDQWPDIFVPGG